MPAGTCKRCGNSTGNPDGRQWYCADCVVAQLRDKRARDKARGKPRKPCKGCGGDKGRGERYRYCPTCRAKGVPQEVERERNRLNASHRYHGHIDRLVVLEMDDGICGICGEDVDPFRYEVDHIIPLARGGEYSYANVQAAHPLCNQRKNRRMPDEGGGN